MPVESSLRSKLRGVWLRPADAKTSYGMMKANERLPDLAAQLAWNQGVRLTALIITSNETHWRAVIKGKQKQKPVVAFLHCESFALLVETLSSEAYHGRLSFRLDDYPHSRKPEH